VYIKIYIMPIVRKYKLEIVAFIGGAVVMILELVGSRILAPYLGTSIIVWTSLIGIILASLSLGYFWGGTLADKNPSYKTLSFIVLISGVLVGLTSLVKNPVLNIVQNSNLDIRLGSVITTLILFSPASITLGMISPYAIRLKTRSVSKSGQSAGSIYAISTLGSIVGTFLAGFVLIATLGSTKILYILAATLLITSIFSYQEFGGKSLKIYLLVIFIIIAADYFDPLFKPTLVLDKDTLYNRVWIYESKDSDTDRPILSLMTDVKGRQSSMFLDGDDSLAIEYTKYFRLFKYFNPTAKRLLMIGGGAYSYPKDFLKQNPDLSIDVVELDPQITLLAKKYFNLIDNPRLTIYHQDGRIFINKTKERYDAVMVDAYHSSLAMPYHLTTKEAAEKIYNVLNKNGVIMMNIISSINGEYGKFLRAEYITYRSVFPQVYLFFASSQNGPLEPGNIMLVALKSPENVDFLKVRGEYESLLKNLWMGSVAVDVPILTDDFAPVEQYVAEILGGV